MKPFRSSEGLFSKARCVACDDFAMRTDNFTVFMKIKECLKNVFFPRSLTCSCCGRESFTAGILCERCLEKAERNDGFICDHCGVKTAVGEAYCPRCKNKLTSFDKARSSFVYGEVTSLLVQKLKYGGEKYLAEEFAKELYRLFVVSISHADGIVCVPMSGKREKNRGYNQTGSSPKLWLSSLPCRFWT